VDQSISEHVSPTGRKSEVSFMEGWWYERLDSIYGLSYRAIESTRVDSARGMAARNRTLCHWTLEEGS
jgi:hypothetical protein